MIRILQRKHHSVLEELLRSVEGNAANNYKDSAQMSYRDLCEKFDELKAAGKLNERQQEYYGAMIEKWSAELKGFRH